MAQPQLTRSQQAILDLLLEHSQPLSAQEIFVALRQDQQRVGLATVYRALETLRNQGQIQAVDLGENQSYYQVLPSDGHTQHHLICTQCHRVIPLPECPVHDLEEILSRQHDFVIDYHVLEFYGICRNCQG